MANYMDWGVLGREILAIRLMTIFNTSRILFEVTRRSSAREVGVREMLRENRYALMMGVISLVVAGLIIY